MNVAKMASTINILGTVEQISDTPGQKVVKKTRHREPCILCSRLFSGIVLTFSTDVTTKVAQGVFVQPGWLGKLPPVFSSSQVSSHAGPHCLMKRHRTDAFTCIANDNTSPPVRCGFFTQRNRNLCVSQPGSRRSGSRSGSSMGKPARTRSLRKGDHAFLRTPQSARHQTAPLRAPRIEGAPHG